MKGSASKRIGELTILLIPNPTNHTEQVRRIVEPWERAGPDVPVSCCVSIRGESRIRFNRA